MNVEKSKNKLFSFAFRRLIFFVYSGKPKSAVQALDRFFYCVIMLE
jgi:hypothetical protein